MSDKVACICKHLPSLWPHMDIRFNIVLENYHYFDCLFLFFSSILRLRQPCCRGVLGCCCSFPWFAVSPPPPGLLPDSADDAATSKTLPQPRLSIKCLKSELSLTWPSSKVPGTWKASVKLWNTADYRLRSVDNCSFTLMVNHANDAMIGESLLVNFLKINHSLFKVCTTRALF